MHTHSHHDIGRARIRGRKLTKVTFIGLSANLLLTVCQIVAGLAGRSIAMVSAGIHALSDVAGDAIVMLLLGLSAKGESPRFKYGRGKLESFASLLIGLILVWVSVELMTDGIASIQSILKGEAAERPSVLVLWVAGLSIFIKLLVYIYTSAMGHKYASPTLIAKSWHELTDALSTIGAMIAAALAIAFGEKWVILDPVAACLISLFVLVPAIQVLVPACKDLLDISISPEEEAQIRETLQQVRVSVSATAERELRVCEVLDLKTRRSGPAVFIEATLLAGIAPADTGSDASAGSARTGTPESPVAASVTLVQAEALRKAAETALMEQAETLLRHPASDIRITLTVVPED